LAKKQNEIESKVLRKVFDSYFKSIEVKGLPYEPYRKALKVFMLKSLDTRKRFIYDIFVKSE